MITGIFELSVNKSSLDNPKIDLAHLYKQVDNKEKEIRLFKIENEVITRENVNMKAFTVYEVGVREMSDKLRLTLSGSDFIHGNCWNSQH